MRNFWDVGCEFCWTDKIDFYFIQALSEAPLNISLKLNKKRVTWSMIHASVYIYLYYTATENYYIKSSNIRANCELWIMTYDSTTMSFDLVGEGSSFSVNQTQSKQLRKESQVVSQYIKFYLNTTSSECDCLNVLCYKLTVVHHIYIGALY